MAFLEVKNVRKQYANHLALDNVSLEIEKQHVYGLLGPNGAGKTTCFNLLTKFLTPTKGVIHFNGIDITKEEPAQIARRGVIRSFQISAVFPHLFRQPFVVITVAIIRISEQHAN